MSKCEKINCENDVYVKGLCRNHYNQEYKEKIKLGIIKKPIRNRFKLNEIINCNDYALIFLYDHEGHVIEKAKIDIEDCDKVKNIKWYFSSDIGYVRANRGKTYLSRYLLDVKPDPDQRIVVDHINQDKLDNRKCNLRITTKSINALNSKTRTDNTSDIVGVSWSEERRKWVAYINYQGNRISLGRFKGKDDAIKARMEAYEKYLGKQT